MAASWPGQRAAGRPKLDLYPGGGDNRRVLAVLAYLNA